MSVYKQFRGVNGGASDVTSAVNIVLAAGAARVQNVTMTVESKSVQAPSALNLGMGGPVYVVRNDGLLTFTFIDAAANAIATVAPGREVSLYLLDNTTIAGTWFTESVAPNSIVSLLSQINYGGF